MTIFFSILFGFAGGFFACFSIVFLIYSLILNKSNNFGDTKFTNPIAKKVGMDSELHLTYQADHIQNDMRVFQQHLEYGMAQLINSPEYKQIMDRSIKSPDSEQVATRGR